LTMACGQTMVPAFNNLGTVGSDPPFIIAI
jgi:hypothetical protein